jgi:two-component system, NtrC family, sensor kinase
MSGAVLVVDDSLTVRMDLVDSLGAAGLDAIPCATLAEARQRLAVAPVSVVILDLLLPDGDGLELLREIRALRDRQIAVLMLSSKAEVDARVRGLATGADEYVGKPYDTHYLISKVRQLLRRQGPAGRFSSGDERPILLIDDSVTFRETLGDALRQVGYATLSAASGEEGLQLAATERPRAIIVDGILPGIDGPTVIRRIRLDAALRAIPCVLMTGARELDAELRALDAGADDFVHKGDDLDLILARLNTTLRGTEMPKGEDEAPSILSPKRILAVDDSPTYRAYVADALRQEGYEVVCATSGEEALELLAVQSVDCILLDVFMPGLGGRETCQRVKATPGLRDIPIVLLTASEDRNSMLEGLATGADDYIQKTAELEVLKARVRAQLRRRQFEDETRRVRERLLKSEIEASEVRATREIAEARAEMIGELELRNKDLADAYAELKSAQSQLVQAAKMASLGLLVAGVAHEVNNPLAFVISHLNTVERSLAEVQEKVDGEALAPARASWDRALARMASIRQGLHRIQDLVLKLRTFSRLDEGEVKTVNVAECVDSVLTILANRLETSQIVVALDLKGPESLQCMPGPFNQALMNIVGNAIDAIGGPGQIRISSDADNQIYTLRIEDTGPGIPLELRERVTEPFFTSKPVGSGTGLGLSITLSIIKKHGGRLRIEDAPGGGAAIVIHLPLQLAAPVS